MRTLFTCLLMLFATDAAAQNLGGVYGPVVKADDRSGQLRLAFVPGEDGGSDRFAARVHYQHALSDKLRLRGVLIGSDGDDFKLRGFQGEAMLQLTPDDSADFQAAVRFDGLIGFNGSPDQLGINFNADQKLSERLTARGVILFGRQFGDARADGLLLQTRGALRYRLDGGVTLATELYNFHGRLGDGGARDRSQLGPTVSLPLGDDVSLLGGWLFGLDRDASDHDARIWLTSRF
ncbi:MAG: hypothetical protein WA979_05255 [Pacificimonas sp.]